MEKNQRVIMGMDGADWVYTFIPLTVEAAADIEDEIWRIGAKIAANVGSEAQGLLSERGKDGISKDDLSVLFSVPGGILDSVPRDTIRSLARSLLNGAVVVGTTTNKISDGWSDPYFRGKWPERLRAIIEAIDVSFPGYFTQAQGFVTDSVKRLLGATTSKESNGESPKK